MQNEPKFLIKLRKINESLVKQRDKIPRCGFRSIPQIWFL